MTCRERRGGPLGSVPLEHACIKSYLFPYVTTRCSLHPVSPCRALRRKCMTLPSLRTTKATSAVYWSYWAMATMVTSSERIARLWTSTNYAATCQAGTVNPLLGNRNWPSCRPAVEVRELTTLPSLACSMPGIFVIRPASVTCEQICPPLSQAAKITTCRPVYYFVNLRDCS